MEFIGQSCRKCKATYIVRDVTDWEPIPAERQASRRFQSCSRFGNSGILPWVRVIARATLLRFVATMKGQGRCKAVKSALDAWFHEAQRAKWRNSAEVKRSYATASIVSADRVVFNIKGNDYRLVTAIDYRRQVVFIKWLGSHRDYDEIEARAVEHGD